MSNYLKVGSILAITAGAQNWALQRQYDQHQMSKYLKTRGRGAEHTLT
jgi:hypothetical protein